jgi:uncharacterized protein
LNRGPRRAPGTKRLLHVGAMAALLSALGVLLLVEAFAPFGGALLGGESIPIRALAALALGLFVGVVSSMLGVAGGELLIPALLFVFGCDIKVAGTCSLVISLAIVCTGLWRYYRPGALLATRGAQRIVASMTVGSLVGAALGALAVSIAPMAFLKVLLGAVLIAAAAKTAAAKSN